MFHLPSPVLHLNRFTYSLAHTVTHSPSSSSSFFSSSSSTSSCVPCMWGMTGLLLQIFLRQGFDEIGEHENIVTTALCFGSLEVPSNHTRGDTFFFLSPDLCNGGELFEYLCFQVTLSHRSPSLLASPFAPPPFLLLLCCAFTHNTGPHLPSAAASGAALCQEFLREDFPPHLQAAGCRVCVNACVD